MVLRGAVYPQATCGPPMVPTRCMRWIADVRLCMRLEFGDQPHTPGWLFVPSLFYRCMLGLTLTDIAIVVMLNGIARRKLSTQHRQSEKSSRKIPHFGYAIVEHSSTVGEVTKLVGRTFNKWVGAVLLTSLTSVSHSVSARFH